MSTEVPENLKKAIVEYDSEGAAKLACGLNWEIKRKICH